MKINIQNQIQNLERISKDKNLSVIIFSFRYQDINYKCFYKQGGEIITMAPVGHDFAINIPINANKLDNYLEERVYFKLKEIHRGKLKTKLFCNSMLDAMLRLTADMALKSNLNFYIAYHQTKMRNINESDKIYFFCWSRSHTGRKPTKRNLDKTKLFFGEEVYLICKINNVSSRWKDKPKKAL